MMITTRIFYKFVSKRVQTTPHYHDWYDIEEGYKMAIYFRKQIHETTKTKYSYQHYVILCDIHKYVADNNKILLYMGEGLHKIKKRLNKLHT